MGLLDQLSSVLGGGGGDQGGPHFGSSPAGQQWGQAVRGTPVDQLAGIFGHTARNVDPNQYRDHVTPGAGGTNPLGMLKGPALALVGGLLLKHMLGSRGGTSSGGGMGGGLGGMLGSVLGGQGGGGLGGLMGGGGGGAGALGGLLGRIPGLTTSDPNQMDPPQVAALADYARQNDPDAFGRAMAEAGHHDPGILHNLLGNQGMMMAAQQLSNGGGGAGGGFGEGGSGGGDVGNDSGGSGGSGGKVLW